MNKRNSLLKSIKTYSGLLVVIVILGFIITLNNPVFMSHDNIIALLRQIAISGIVGMGMGILIISGDMDLTVGSVAGFSALLAALLLEKQVSVPVVILISLLFGMVVGLVNGLVVSLTGVNAFIFTLAFDKVIRGAVYLISEGKPISISNKTYLEISRGSMAGVPTPIIILVVILIVSWMFLNKTVTGRQIYATGANRLSASYSGVDVIRTKVIAFITCGILASFAGLLLASKLQSSQPTAGSSYAMDAICIAAIGGCSFAGGEGSVVGIILGAIIIGIINNGMVMIGINSYWQTVVNGLVIIFAVLIDVFRKYAVKRSK